MTHPSTVKTARCKVLDSMGYKVYYFSMKTLIAILLGVCFSISAHATCYSSYVCDGSGANCGYQDVCDSAVDMPSINIQPMPSMPTTAIQPMPSMAIPPIGTSQCQYVQVNGAWQNVCY